MLARGLPGFQYVNNITDFPKALGNSATIAGVVRKRLRAPLELRLCLASFRGMMDFVFKPSLRLARLCGNRGVARLLSLTFLSQQSFGYCYLFETVDNAIANQLSLDDASDECAMFQDATEKG